MLLFFKCSGQPVNIRFSIFTQQNIHVLQVDCKPFYIYNRKRVLLFTVKYFPIDCIGLLLKRGCALFKKEKNQPFAINMQLEQLLMNRCVFVFAESVVRRAACVRPVSN